MADDSVTSLPLVGQPDSEHRLTTYFNRLRTEAIPSRSTFCDPHQRCMNFYLYGTATPGQKHVYNKIQGMVNAYVDQAVRNMPTISVEPITVTDGGASVFTTGGQAVTLDGATIADYLQHAVDTVLEKSRYERFFKGMAFYAKLLGWQDALVEYDHDEKKMCFRIIPPLQWYKDPTAEEIDDMAYIGLDWPVDAEWAKRKYPQLAEQIDKAAARAIKFTPSSSGYSDVYVSQTYARPVVTLSIWWLRNREAPMTDQEAMQAGLVESRLVPMESPSVPGSPANLAPDEPTGNPGGFEADGTSPSPAAPSDAGLPEQPPVAPPPPPMREGLFLIATGEEIGTDHPLWPRRVVLSQSIQLMDEVVEDKVCEYWDIPVVSNFNVRIPNRPYGQADAVRVDSLQEDRNTIHASTVNHARWFQGPINILPQSMKAELPTEFVSKGGIEPNKTYWIEDDMLRRLLDVFKGKVIGQYDPPPLPPALLQVGQELDSAFDSAGGRPDVSQGKAPTANSSGELAKILMSAAQSQNDFTTMYLEEMAWRVARLALHCILTNWGPEDFYAINRTFDPQTTAMLVAQAQSMEFAIRIEPTGTKEQNEAKILAYFQAGLLTKETAQDKLGIDAKQEQQREAQAMASAAVAGANPSDEQLQSEGDGQQPAGNGSFKRPRLQRQPA